MKFRPALIVLIIGVLLFSGCNSADSNSANDESLTVSAAVSLKDAFTEIGAVYEAKTGRPVVFNFASSGALQRQIEAGAPVDVFASAAARLMDELEAKDFIDKNSRRDFASNALVLIAPKDRRSKVSGFEILADPQIKKIALGNLKTVPAGQYADEVFEKLNLKERVKDKLIFGENVRQVLEYVARGEVDLGIVYRTDALTAAGRVDVAAAAPENSHSPILYPAALIKDSKNRRAAEEFIELLLSAEGQNILRKHGFSGF
jgi:molybdate transport system substrate-binding protein